MKKEEITKIYNFLSENEYIGPGKIVDSEVLKELFQEDDVDEIYYRGPLLAIKDLIRQKDGYFSETVQGSIHICTDDEKSYYAKKERLKRERKLHEAADVMIKTDQTKISDSDLRREHQHQLNILLMLNRKTRLILEEMGEI